MEITVNLGRVFNDTWKKIKSRWLNILVAIILLMLFVVPQRGFSWVKFEIISLFLTISFYDVIKNILKELDRQITEHRLNLTTLLKDTYKHIKSDLILVAISGFLIYRYVIPAKGSAWLIMKIVEIFLAVSVFDILKDFFDSMEEELELE